MLNKHLYLSTISTSFSFVKKTTKFNLIYSVEDFVVNVNLMKGMWWQDEDTEMFPK